MNTRDPGKPGAEDDGIDELPIGPLALEKAPASLTRRLYRIPFEHGEDRARKAFGLPGWAFSLAVVAVAAVAVALFLDPGDGNTPDAGSQVAGDQRPEAAAGPNSTAGTEPPEVAAARRDLAIAFSYLDKAGLRTSREIRAVLREELAEPVKDNLSRHLPYMAQATKEKHA